MVNTRILGGWSVGKDKIWRAMTALGRHNGYEVWGNTEWASVVLTVPKFTYGFFCSRLT